MTDTTATCARGCTTRNRHKTTCDDRDKCRGCLPRSAEHGHLCYPCHARMQQWFEEIAGVPRNVTIKPGHEPVVMILPPGGTRAWLTDNLPAGKGAAPADQPKITGSREQPTPIKLAILDCRDLLSAQIADLVDDMRETHNLTAPSRRGVEADARFLLTWQGTLERHDWVTDWWDALMETMGQAHALAPWRALDQRCSGIACPECGEMNLVLYGGDSDVSCQSCRTMIPPKRYAIWTRMLAEGVSA